MSRNTVNKKLKRKNPAAALRGGDLLRMTADLALSAALEGCTVAEKFVIAAMIPGLLPVIRTVPQPDLVSIMKNSFGPGVDLTGVVQPSGTDPSKAN